MILLLNNQNSSNFFETVIYRWQVSPFTMAQDSPEYRPEVQEAGLKEKDPNHRPAVDIQQNFNRRLSRRRYFWMGKVNCAYVCISEH